ncbi:immunoglobulin superfamily DCC subclass member 4-like [Phascolarctos cinereus]|uniref:Hemicentin-2-like n=1 Tax=Phascolarctos cinereus TaxID=38626 RepID=A0A6P5JGK0_PHACI|nr:hemicentin-2-like [Phascolarctos cinereus]XP_020833355.1 hemicentin-2-like [Phascolarctos cinereus]
MDALHLPPGTPGLGSCPSRENPSIRGPGHYDPCYWVASISGCRGSHSSWQVRVPDHRPGPRRHLPGHLLLFICKVSGREVEARFRWLGPDGEEAALGGSSFSAEPIYEASVGLRVTLSEPGQERPRILGLNLSPTVAEEGSVRELQCKVSGIPQPNITWEHQGLVLGGNGRVSVQDGTLTIRDLEPSDAEVYTCEASIAERMESARENEKLRVTFRPRLEGPKGNAGVF